MSNPTIRFSNDSDLVGHTGRFNSLGDELVTFRGISDGGETGWFNGARIIDHRDPDDVMELNTPMIFYRTLRNAIEDLESGYFDKFEAQVDLSKFRL